MEKIKVLIYLISMVGFCYAGESVTFKELTNLASDDIGKTIYLDKDIKNYSVDINLVDYQRKGEIFEFYKIVLFDNGLDLQFNFNNDFYYIKRASAKAIAPKPIHHSLKLHYYTYKIKNITNEDVVKAMGIFKDVKYQYLKQSDIIAYSSTYSDHEQIEQILNAADNKVIHQTIKITLFSINKKKFVDMGSSIRAFQYDFDSTFDGIFQAFKSGGSSQFDLKDSASLSFTLHALKGHNIADIYQQPTIRLTNGVESSVMSVVNVPYLKTTATVDSTTNSITEQYEYKDIGLQIKVLPKIKDDWIYLDLNLISDELLSLDDDKPITQKITYRNSIKVVKGHPILLTGIKKTSKQIEKDGVPYLSDVPFLGELFKQRSEAKEEQNVNILIEVI